MLIIAFYGNYINKLLCINDLYCIAIKHTFKELLADYYKEKDAIN